MRKKIIRGLLVASLGNLLSLTNVFACSVCYLAVGSPQTDGLNMGILSLLMILIVVMGCVVTFFLQVRKKTKLLVATNSEI